MQFRVSVLTSNRIFFAAFLAPTFIVVQLVAVLPGEAKQTFEQRYAEAEKFRMANDYANGINRYQSLIKMRPADSRVHANYGFILVQTGKFKEAKEEIDRALMLNDDDPSAHQALAMYYMFQGDKAHARLEYIRVIALDPKRNCHCGGIQKFLGITPTDEKKALREAARHGRMPRPAKPRPFPDKPVETKPGPGKPVQDKLLPAKP